MASSTSPTDDDVSSVLSTTYANSSLTTELQRLSLIDSNTAESSKESASSSTADGYAGISWDRLPGFQIPHHTKYAKRSWIWDYGYEIEETKSGKKYFLCRFCHQVMSPKNHKWIETSTGHPIAHLQSEHGVKDGIRKKRPQVFDAFENNSSDDQATINHLIKSFNPQKFKTALTRWMCYDNVKLRQVDTEPFRRMMLASNNALELAGCLPSRNTVRAWIMDDWKRHKRVVTALLDSVRGQIHISFDLWTALNLLCLNGIVAHFIDEEAQKRTFLLGLPQVEGTHSGENIADGVGAIIREFNIQDRIGYFVLDNASNNDTCIQALAEDFEFDPQQRRLRCAGHIINLVAKAFLFGHDFEAFESEVETPKELVDEFNLWRKRGPIGKIHNIVTYIGLIEQRGKLFRKFQEMELTTLDGKKRILQLIKDNDTRWNSTFSMIARAVELQASIDAMAQHEKQAYDKYLERLRKLNDQRSRNKKINPKPPPAIVDDMLTGDDWDALNQYLEILAPLKQATLRLEGRAIKGQWGALWEVLPTFEYLLETFEVLKERYAFHPNEHFKVQINLAWQKLDEYYNRLDDTPVYVAALALHPKYKMRWIKKKWKNRPEWIQKAEASLRDLWITYKCKGLDEDEEMEKENEAEEGTRRRREPSGLDAYLDEDIFSDDDTTLDAAADELSEWQATTVLTDKKVTNPIQYWHGHRERWPRLARMAIDLFGVPAMSSEPERVFSDAGDVITPKRNRLHADIVGAGMCLKQWDKDGVIDWQ